MSDGGEETPGLIKSPDRPGEAALPPGLPPMKRIVLLFALIGSKSALAEAEEEIAAVAHGLEQEKKQ